MSQAPKKPLDHSPSDWSLVRKLVPFLRGDRHLYILALIAAPISTLLVVVQPYLMKRAIDDAILVGDAATLESLAFFYLGAVIVGFLAETGYTITISYAAMRTITRLREGVYTHTLEMAQGFFDREPTGKLLTRATSDVDALGETLTAGAITIILDVLLVTGILIAMFTMHASLTLVMLVLAPALGFVVDRIRRILRKLYLKVRTALATLNAFTAERLEGVRVVQLYSDEERAVEAYEDRLYRYRDATIRTNIWDALLFAFVDGLSSIAVALMLYWGGIVSAEGAVTAGLLAAFIDYVGRLFEPIRNFSAKIAVIQRAISALEKIFGLLDHHERITPGDEELAGEFDGICFENVSFRYGDEGDNVLSDVSFEIGKGEVVALVGRTGSGKSTIAKLLIRAYDGYEGSILFGGAELSNLRLDDVRRELGMVHQDVQLFPGDVRFNLTLGREVDDETLWENVRLMRATPAVEKLGGLEGRVQHKGGNLSVGEGQLLSFARTMVYDPPVVILDEATASVDTMTEAAIQEATDAIFERKTVLVIAHRLSTIMNADRILVLDAGRVIESGSHTELMEAGGMYADLFHSQFAEQSQAA